jgi:hypothetical protein
LRWNPLAVQHGVGCAMHTVQSLIGNFYNSLSNIEK